MAHESWATNSGTRRSMQGNRSKDTSPELAVRRLLHAAGLRYRLHVRVPGDTRRTIDIAFPRQRVAVFIDGCYWHGCVVHYKAPRANADFWRSKIEQNRARDIDTVARLEQAGWRVLRYWTHEPAVSVATSVQRELSIQSAPIHPEQARSARNASLGSRG